MKQFFLTFLIISISIALLAQEPITVLETIFKLKANTTENYYYSFAEGDKIIINLEEINGKEIKQFDFIEEPTTIKYSSIKITSIIQKELSIQKTNVYHFKFTGPAIGNRECKFTILRIPQSNKTINYNTDWKWATIYDTTYTTYNIDSIIGYDTIPIVEIKKELDYYELREEMLIENTENIHSIGIIQHDNPRTFLPITLPMNKYSEYVREEVISWAYWIGVGNNSNEFWKQNIKKYTQIANTFLGIKSPIGLLASNAISDLLIPTNTDNVNYAIVANTTNRDAFMSGRPYYSIGMGNGPGGYGKFIDRYLQGTYYICMYNDNVHDQISVNIKVCAIIKTSYFKEVKYEKTNIVPKTITLQRRKMTINDRQIRVPTY